MKRKLTDLLALGGLYHPKSGQVRVYENKRRELVIYECCDNEDNFQEVRRYKIIKMVEMR